MTQDFLSKKSLKDFIVCAFKNLLEWSTKPKKSQIRVLLILNNSKKIFEIFFEFGKVLKTNFSPLLKKFCKKTSKACYYPNPLFGSIKKTRKKLLPYSRIYWPEKQPATPL